MKILILTVLTILFSSIYAQNEGEVIEIPYIDEKVTLDNSTISEFFNQYFPDVELYNRYTYSITPYGKILYIKCNDKIYYTDNRLNEFIIGVKNRDSTEYESETLMKLYVLLIYIL